MKQGRYKLSLCVISILTFFAGLAGHRFWDKRHATVIGSELFRSPISTSWERTLPVTLQK